MNASLRVTLLAGVEPTARAVRAHAMKNCVDVMMAISDMGSRGETGSHGERWTRLRDDLFRLRALVAEELRDELTVAPIRPARTRPCCVATLVDSVVARLAERAADADVNVFVDHGGGVIFADEWPIAEALFTVLANAIQATAGGGSIFVSTSETSEGDQHWVIRDMGTGMGPDQLTKLGRQLDAGRRGVSGFGIAIARSAVGRQGGLLAVESALGSGKTVTIWLPRRGNDPPSGVDDHIAHQPGLASKDEMLPPVIVGEMTVSTTIAMGPDASRHEPAPSGEQPANA